MPLRFNDGHGCQVVGGDGVVVQTGIGEGGVGVAVAEQALNGGDLAAGVEQLGGEGVAQLVGRDFDARSLSGGFEAAANKVFTDRFVAKEENVVSLAAAAQRPHPGHH